MKDNEDKLTAGKVLLFGFLGLSAVIAAPVIGAAWVIKKGLEAVGIDDTPSDNPTYDW